MAKDYLLDENMNGKEPVCRNLVNQQKRIHRLPHNMRGHPDTDVVNFAKQTGRKLITKDRGCAQLAKERNVPVILIKHER